MNEQFDDQKSLRLSIYALLIVSTVATMTARIFSASSADGHTPFFSANDRSRWSAISAIVDEGTYVIDNVRRRPGWRSIDMVRHEGRDGREHYYSSKPPLYPTLLALQYATIKTTTGVTLAEYPFYVARVMLLVTNVMPLILFFALLVRWVEAHGETDWGRIFVIACACWGTYLTTFAISLNNHLPASICVMICAYCVFRVWDDADPHPIYFVVCGLAAAFTAANELPALSFLAAISLVMFGLSPQKTLVLFVPAVLLVVLAFFVTNFIAHDSLLPPYAHRQPGDNWYDYTGSYWTSERSGIDKGEPSRLVYGFNVLIGHHGIFSLSPIWILSVAGLFVWLVKRTSVNRCMAILTIALMAICLTFYIVRLREIDRNYGGRTSGFRWMFWFIPLWLMSMMPVADWLAEGRARRGFGLVLLGISILSAQYAAANPWSHPWIYDYWQALNWIGP